MDRRSADSAQTVLGPEGLLASRMDAFEVRQAQLDMARQVQATLDGDQVLVAEAGTGTGKTLAYLVPLVLSGRKVVISTGTKTLQEQIVRRDAPELLRHLGLSLSVACMKGISNYLCLRRLDEYKRSMGRLVPDPLVDELLAWADATETGDRSDLAGLPDGDPLWAEVSPTPESRIGPRCPFFDGCMVTRMRRKAASARIVVVNHHLLFADLVLRAEHPEAAVLPEHEVLVLDEAHQLEDVATAFFGHSASDGMLQALCRDAGRTGQLHDDPQTLLLSDAVVRSTRDLFYTLRSTLGRLAGGNGDGRAGANGARMRLRQPPLAGAAERGYHQLDARLEALGEHLEGMAERHEDARNLVKRAGRLRQTLSLFAEHPQSGTILWAERRRRSLTLHASPVEVGALLQQTLLKAPIPMVFTSATLATATSKKDNKNNGLGYFLRRLGLEGPALEGRLDTLELASPFDFDRQTLLYLARDLPPPGAPTFVQQAARRMEALVNLARGRALLLCTSYRNMNAVTEYLRAVLPYRVLCQGDRPRSALLAEFRRDIQSVLVATASFWEGVDVVGESLSLVVMDKLPFDVPDEPLTAARIEQLRQAGESPFARYQLPRAGLALKQGFGRLIRHRADRGVVGVLDRRLVERGYGKVLLRCLPPCPHTDDLSRVEAFFGPHRNDTPWTP